MTLTRHKTSQHRPIYKNAIVLNHVERRKWAEHHHPSLSASWLAATIHPCLLPDWLPCDLLNTTIHPCLLPDWLPCDQLPHIPTPMTPWPHWNHSLELWLQINPFFLKSNSSGILSQHWQKGRIQHRHFTHLPMWVIYDSKSEVRVVSHSFLDSIHNLGHIRHK